MFAEFEDDEDDYDAVEETPVVVGKSNGAPAVPGVVVPTVATTTATAAAQASQPTPSPVVVSVPSVAVPTMASHNHVCCIIFPGPRPDLRHWLRGYERARLSQQAFCSSGFRQDHLSSILIDVNTTVRRCGC